MLPKISYFYFSRLNYITFYLVGESWKWSSSIPDFESGVLDSKNRVESFCYLFGPTAKRE
jgi:hypothetical protein